MTAIVDRPEDFAATALAGFCALHPGLVRPVRGGAVRAAPAPAGKVAVVTGGGSGHFPAFAGYVGPGLADAAVAGDVFASPSAQAVAHVARQAHRGGGVLMCFGNYAGDVLNFTAAADRLVAEGIPARVLAVTDDVASAPAADAARRRGVAGDLMVLKVAGAAAEAGLPLGEVERLARLANARTASFGVAFSGCTLPGAAGPLFTVPAGRMGIGLGIHGEPGLGETNRPSASELAALLVDRLLAERPAGAPRAAAALNGLGATKHEELFVLWTRVAARLAGAGVEVVEPEVGELVTSLDMAGCSLSLTWLDDELEPLWRAPAWTFVMKRGRAGQPPADGDAATEVDEASTAIPPAPPEAQAAGRCVASLLDTLAARMQGDEAELGQLDALAGDGDHGQGMARGSAAAAAAARDASGRGGGAATVLALAGDAWADRAGGTSGALWGMALRAWAGCLDDRGAVSAAQAAAGAAAGLAAIRKAGGAEPGDKTLVDAYAPFAAGLSSGVTSGASLKEAWAAAAEAAEAAAKATADLVPRRGRARPHAEKSLGHPDAGAVSLARCAVAVARALR